MSTIYIYSTVQWYWRRCISMRWSWIRLHHANWWLTTTCGFRYYVTFHLSNFFPCLLLWSALEYIHKENFLYKQYTHTIIPQIRYAAPAVSSHFSTQLTLLLQPRVNLFVVTHHRVILLLIPSHSFLARAKWRAWEIALQLCGGHASFSLLHDPIL